MAQIYVDVAEKIMSDILNNDPMPGQKVKSVREYALQFKVNAKTIQRSFEYLDKLEIFISVVGGGRFLRDDIDVKEKIKYELIYSEAKTFVTKMKKYNLSLEEIKQIIKENYERND